MISPLPLKTQAPQVSSVFAYEGLIRQYELLYFAKRRTEAKKGEALLQAPRDNDELARLSQLLWEHYKAQRAERYRTAMWLRRTVLHQQGRDNEVYNGCDAVAWCQEARLIGLV